MSEYKKVKEQRILFIGASGSGTSTLGKLLSDILNIFHFELDDLFWKPTEVPFTQFRSKVELKELIEKKLFINNSWIISGDPSEWEVGIESKLTKVIYLECPTEIRVKRLNERELKKQGKKMLKGGINYPNHIKFIEWAKKYDEGGISGRTKYKQEQWIKKLNCEIHRLNTALSIEELALRLLKI